MTDDYHCNKCKKGKRAKRCFEFVRLPNILVIHLKRFRFSGTGRYGGGQKLNQKIVFPIKGLNLGNFINK